MSTAVIGIGSNVAPEKSIPKARRILSEKYTVVAESEFIKTKPLGLPGQADFINGAVMIETSFGDDQLKASLKRIERFLGRQKNSKFGPRTIDLDILVWNDKIIHRDFYTRGFIKRSVLDLMPGLKY